MLQDKEIESRGTYYESSNMFHGSLKNIMGTRFDLLIIGQSGLKSLELWKDIMIELRVLDKIFNRFDDTSETSDINRRAFPGGVRVSQEMWYILRSCRMYHARTLGLFDVTRNDFSKVLLCEEECTVIFPEKRISLDFGGYAKGYALLKIKNLTVQAQVKHCFVDFGNSAIMGIGHHPYGDAWKVSIENPYKRDKIIDELSLRDHALSVSGNTPSYTGHIIRPASGEKIKEDKLVAVTSEDPLDAEVLSTVFMIADTTEKKQIAANFNVQDIAEYTFLQGIVRSSCRSST